MSDLRPIHRDADIDPGSQGKIIAGAIVALVILIIAGFGWQAGWWKGMHEPVPDNRLPQASMPLVPSKG